MHAKEQGHVWTYMERAGVERGNAACLGQKPTAVKEI